jgi:uncharacterized membrane protein
MRLPRGHRRKRAAHPRRSVKPTRGDKTPSSRLAPIVERNIQAIAQHREEAEANRSREERIADWITWFSGNMPFVYFHAAWFTVWILINLGLFGLPVFDPFPYGLLTMVVSLEAIFLSTFVLVSQNRQAQLADRRAELDLQTNLLAEHEVTRILTLLDAITTHLGIEEGDDPELPELEEEVDPESLLSELEAQEGAGAGGSRKTNGTKKGAGRAAKKPRAK